jgi:hypothetical protein
MEMDTLGKVDGVYRRLPKDSHDPLLPFEFETFGIGSQPAMCCVPWCLLPHDVGSDQCGVHREHPEYQVPNPPLPAPVLKTTSDERRPDRDGLADLRRVLRDLDPEKFIVEGTIPKVLPVGKVGLRAASVVPAGEVGEGVTFGGLAMASREAVRWSS